MRAESTRSTPSGACRTSGLYRYRYTCVASSFDYYSQLIYANALNAHLRRIRDGTFINMHCVRVNERRGAGDAGDGHENTRVNLQLRHERGGLLR